MPNVAPTAAEAPRQLDASAILDLRAYERERAALRAEAMRTRRERRVLIGPLLSVTFENRVTLRHQIHEMLRVERSLDERAVDAEISAYAPLMPGPGELSLTVLLELTDNATMQRWLRDLAGIERCVHLINPAGDRMSAHPESGHAKTLTRTDVTASVHYLRLPVRAEDLVPGSRLVVDHPNYQAESALAESLLAGLIADIS